MSDMNLTHEQMREILSKLYKNIPRNLVSKDDIESNDDLVALLYEKFRSKNKERPRWNKLHSDDRLVFRRMFKEGQNNKHKPNITEYMYKNSYDRSVFGFWLVNSSHELTTSNRQMYRDMFNAGLDYE